MSPDKHSIFSNLPASFFGRNSHVVNNALLSKGKSWYSSVQAEQTSYANISTKLLEGSFQLGIALTQFARENHLHAQHQQYLSRCAAKIHQICAESTGTNRCEAIETVKKQIERELTHAANQLGMLGSTHERKGVLAKLCWWSNKQNQTRREFAKIIYEHMGINILHTTSKRSAAPVITHYTSNFDLPEENSQMSAPVYRGPTSSGPGAASGA